jgi:hypothetical protein
MATGAREYRRRDGPVLLQQPPALASKIGYASLLYVTKGLVASLRGYQGLKEYIWPPKVKPDDVKTYHCRPHLPVRSVEHIKSYIGSSL